MTLRSSSELTAFEVWGRQTASLNWYAIADSAQHRSLPDALAKPGRQVRCLLGASQGSPVAAHAPHLVELDSPSQDSGSWKWISLNAKSRPCLSVIASELSFDALLLHLMKCTEVVLPDDESMFFAFWDPAILGTLVGQFDDFSLHVKGPVLTLEQKNAVMCGMSQWWYWDRNGMRHTIVGAKSENLQAFLPITLTQVQVDDLVEASVPDHILYYLELNQPALIETVSLSQRYEFVRRSLCKARSIGLVLMGDLVNFVCLELIYGGRMQQDIVIINLLDNVKSGKITFRDAVEQFP